MAIIRTTPTLFTPARADAMAAELNSDGDDDWTYTARHDPKGTGGSLIDIYDEDGEFIGPMGTA